MRPVQRLHLLEPMDPSHAETSGNPELENSLSDSNDPILTPSSPIQTKLTDPETPAQAITSLDTKQDEVVQGGSVRDMVEN